MAILGIAALLASGILFNHSRLLTFLATAGVLFEGLWLALTLISSLLLAYGQSVSSVFMGGSILVLLLALFGVKNFRIPWAGLPGSGRRDVVVLILLVVTLASSWMIVSSNGFRDDHTWITHGFYNGDTVTFASLIQRSLATPGLLEENPFSGGGELEYPTLLHSGFARAIAGLGFGYEWLHFLPVLTLIQAALTIPMFFLLVDVLFPEPGEGWKKWFGVPSRWAVLGLQGLVILYVLGLSWDNYVYPQSHFFLTGLFLLQACLYAVGHAKSGKAQWMWVGPAVVSTIVLMISNAVTGTAALAVAGVFCLLRADDKKRSVVERMGFVGVAILLVGMFVLFIPGQGSLGVMPGFSYTAAFDMLRLAPVLMLLLFGVWMYRDRIPFIGMSVVGLMALAFIVYVFSSRDIVVANASRFFYHAVLVGFPLLIAPLIQLYYWLRRELLFVSQSFVVKAGSLAAFFVLLGLVLLPAGASVASAHDNLLFQDEQVVDTAMRRAMWWLQANSSPDAVVLTSLEAPWATPLFTGRSLLRADYWLSSDDVLLSEIQAAFEGERVAQEQVFERGQADYLLLTEDERTAWEPVVFEKVFDVNSVVIYSLN